MRDPLYNSSISYKQQPYLFQITTFLHNFTLETVFFKHEDKMFCKVFPRSKNKVLAHFITLQPYRILHIDIYACTILYHITVTIATNSYAIMYHTEQYFYIPLLWSLYCLTIANISGYIFYGLQKN